MIQKSEQDRVRTLLSDTITLLCRNGLTYKSEICVSALVGITLDKDDVFLVDIRDTFKNSLAPSRMPESDSQTPVNDSQSKVSKKKRRRSSISISSDSDNEHSRKQDIKTEVCDYGAQGIVIKNEPLDFGNDNELFISSVSQSASSTFKDTVYTPASIQQCMQPPGNHNSTLPSIESTDVDNFISQVSSIEVRQSILYIDFFLSYIYINF